ncbi:ThuA domain-containing protein [Dactylosporangium cerinum]|uniref:ThuA domain-containing protein n=1 Tax=Dactylosporangium cerinum TaxID=1434730 RepID=A0ABV9WAC0_9ACTN
MRRHFRRACLATLAAVSLILPVTATPAHAAARFRVLVFSKTTNFYHDSIPAGIAAIQQLGTANNFEVEATTDAAAFTDANLARFDALVFNNTNSTPAAGDLLNAAQRTALQNFVRAGKGWVGLHAATASERDWTWYEGLVGTIFENHPDFSATGGVYPGRIKVLDRAHPSTKNLPELWERSEEWYNWITNPTGKVHTLAQIKVRDGISGLNEGVDHAYSWCQNYDGGRSWYTAGGHSSSSFSEPAFLEHLRGGIEWAAGAVAGECGATKTGNFQRVPLVNQNLSDPFELAVLPDRRVLYIQRTGQLKAINQDTLAVTTLLDFGYTSDLLTQSDGLLGLTADPNFATNQFVYLLYTDKVSKQINIARYTIGATAATDPKVLLTIPTWRGEGRANSHMGGGLAMGRDGLLYAAIGDNTDPFESSGYTPIDERSGRRAWDAQGTAGNTNDLRGKILRIRPNADGTYSNPAGNLFAPGTAKTRPEIYAMGFRNPFRISVDPLTNAVLVADYGPDARAADANRGPEGTVEFDRVTSAGNYGWPYCIGNNTPFNDYNFATSTAGAKFNCAAPVNNSPNNTGLTSLPAARGALVWYAYSASTQFPELGTGGGGPMSGPVYDYDPANTRATKFPEYYENKWIVYELTRTWFKTLSIHKTAQTFTDARFGPTKVGDLQSINPLFPDFSWIQPFDAEFGPDGSLYVIDFGSGTGSGRGGTNDGAGIYRIDYTANGSAPVAKVAANKDSGPTPLAVTFSSAGSSAGVTYAWDFDGNGTTDSTAANPSYTYTTKGQFNARLTVRNPANGLTAVATTQITAGNTRPTVTISVPNGGFADFGDRIPYTVTVTDPEDASVVCSRVVTQSLLGHDTHAHPLDNYTGCSGLIITDSGAGDGHGPGQNLYTVLTAQYTDGGATGGVPALTGSTQVRLRAKSTEAEHLTSSSGVTVFDRASAHAGKRVGDIDNNDWLAYSNVNFKGIGSVTAGVSSVYGGTIEFRNGSTTGALLGTLAVPSSGSYDNLISPTANLTNPGSTFNLYVVFKNPATPPPAGTYLMSVDWLRFNGAGVKQETGATLTGSASPATGGPRTVSFSGVATPPAGRTIVKYEWDFGDNAPLFTSTTSATTTHAYNRTGTFTTRLTIIDSAGAPHATSVTVTVT